MPLILCICVAFQLSGSSAAATPNPPDARLPAQRWEGFIPAESLPSAEGLPLAFGPGISGDDQIIGVIRRSRSHLHFASCFADYDLNGSVSVDDLFQFIDHWLIGYRSSLGGGAHRTVDLDDNGHVNDADLHIYLSAWFSGCG